MSMRVIILSIFAICLLISPGRGEQRVRAQATAVVRVVNKPQLPTDLKDHFRHHYDLLQTVLADHSALMMMLADEKNPHHPALIPDNRDQREVVNVETIQQYWMASDWQNQWRMVFDFNLDTFQVGSVVNQIWRNQAWKDTLRFTFSYNEHGDETEWLWESKPADTWLNEFRSVTEYDADNNPETRTEYDWDGGVWQNLQRILYEHESITRAESRIPDDAVRDNPNFQLTLETYQFWMDNNWLDSQRIHYHYYLNGLLQEELNQYYYGQWFDFQKTIYTYDNNGNVIEELYQDFFIFDWENGSRTVYTYTGNVLVHELTQSWQGFNRNWDDLSQIIYTYDGELLVEELEQLVSYNRDWENNYRTLYYYQPDGYPTEEIRQDWQANSWVNSERFLFNFEDISGGDVSLGDMISHVLGFSLLNPAQMVLADLNNDNDVDVRDLVLKIDSGR